jgi:hypothetical protein
MQSDVESFLAQRPKLTGAAHHAEKYSPREAAKQRGCVLCSVEFGAAGEERTFQRLLDSER